MSSPVVVTVELYGSSRLLASQPFIEISLKGDTTIRAALKAIADRLPRFIGPVLLPDLSGLTVGYMASVNGLVFVDDLDVSLRSGDVLLILPAASGGCRAPLERGE